MDRFIGLDAHVSSCTLAVVGGSGRKIRLDVVETQASALVAYVQGVAWPKRLCFEEGTLSEWLYELLSPHVTEVVVMGQNPAGEWCQPPSDTSALGLSEHVRGVGSKGRSHPRVEPYQGQLTKTRDADGA